MMGREIRLVVRLMEGKGNGLMVGEGAALIVGRRAGLNEGKET